MKFKTTTYHSHLLKDNQRLSVFYEAISDYAKDYNVNHDVNEDNLYNLICYDLGCGSGVLSYFLARYFNAIVSFEKDSKIADCAKENLKDYENVMVINCDVCELGDVEPADIVVCEMLDTALIDEEQVPCLNHFRNNIKDTGVVIPSGVFNIAEPVNMGRSIVHYEDDDSHPSYNIIGEKVSYSKIDFNEYIEPNFSKILTFKINKDSTFNGMKITTFTLLNENIICGDTSMFNPCLFIPTDEVEVKSGDIVKVHLSYIMGGGIETIKTEIIK